MKYCLIIPDGAADEPCLELDGKTPLEVARIPHMHRVAAEGRLGTVKTVPDSLPPGSDVANLSILGYNPEKHYSGRAPLEAASMGIPLGPDEWAFRCNLVTVEGDEGTTMVDFSAGHVKTEESRRLVEALNESLGTEALRFHPGVSYRNLLVWKTPDEVAAECTPPHDIIGRPIAAHLPRGKGAETLNDLMARSRPVLAAHEINQVRVDLGENPANMIWLWGGGKTPSLRSFQDRFGLRGASIGAVDLVRGLCRLAGFRHLEVLGATGYVDTNYRGKGERAVEAMNEYDFVFVHVEAPDEAGHDGDLRGKIRALEAVDQYIVGPVLDAVERMGDARVLVLPDHLTPVAKRTHARGAVPFTFFGERVPKPLVAAKGFTEREAAASDLRVDQGHLLMEYFLKSHTEGV